MRNIVLTICAVALAVAMLTGGCERSGQDTGQDSAGDLTASEFLTKHKLLGKPVLIEFGMAECELSHEGFSTMITLKSADIIESLQYVRVECSKDIKGADKYHEENPADFPVVKDPGGQVSEAFKATIYPIFMLVDKFGNTRYMGEFPIDDLGDWSAMLLAEKSDPGPNKPRLGVKEINGQELLASTKLPELGGSDQALVEYAGPGGIMLVFADANCPYSSIAIRELPGVANTLRKAALVSTVVVNITDSEDKVREYYAKQKLDRIPVVYDEGSAVRMDWDVQSVPTIVFFDAQGRMAYNGPAVWANVGRAGEGALGLRPGTLKFGSRGTKFG
ncbi:MAG: redoxin domain-containing protein [Phycisphaerae bacterium]|nr:redoxin domain-containing protein [Phycisphaerae bacterium]